MKVLQKPKLLFAIIVFGGLFIVGLAGGALGEAFGLGFLGAPIATLSVPAESISSEPNIGSFHITNTMITTWATIVILIVLSFFATRKIKEVPTGLQNIFEAAIEYFQKLGEGVSGKRFAKFIPLVITIFLFILIAIWIGILGIIIFLARPKRMVSLSLFFGNIFLGLFSPFLWNALKPYQQNRILTLFNPEKDPLGAAYQIIQSKTAIGSGGLFGKGWGVGTQTHLKFLPVQESDFILSVMGEELGFISISLVLLVFGFFIVQILKRSYLSKDRFSSLALMGFSSIFMTHVFVNTAMTVGLIPVKGLPFPFISAGGSFLISSYIMIGLILKLSVNYSE